jgi:hypothetical protein
MGLVFIGEFYRSAIAPQAVARIPGRVALICMVLCRAVALSGLIRVPAQSESLDFTRSGLGKCIDEFYESRVFIWGQSGFDELLQIVFTGGCAFFQYHVGLGLGQAVLVLVTHDRHLENRIVLHQGGFHLKR